MTTTRIEITAKDNTAAAFASADSNLAKLSRSVSNVTSALGALGIGFSTFTVGRAIIDATTDMQRFNQSLIVGTGLTQKAAEEMRFLRSEADRLGLDLQSSAEQYSKLAAAARGTALEGQATRDIFRSISQAATVLGLSADEAGGALTAIQQIISKGTVSAEELRGQLGERLPGAFQIAARSIGVTTQELDKLLKTGSLTAEQLLPALASELNNTFGPQAEQAAQGLNAQMNRFNTAMFDLKVAIGELGLIEMFTAAINAGTALANVLATKIIPQVKQFAEFINSIPGVSTVISAAFGGGTFGLIKKFSDDTKAASQAMQELSVNADNISKKQFFAPLVRDSDKTARSLREAAKAEREMQRETQRLEKEIHDLTLEYDPLFKLNTELAKLVELRNKGLREDIFDSAAASAIEKYISSLESIETVVESIGISERDLGRTTQEVFGSMEQIAIQGARNIQTAFADGLFRLFDDGLKGMVNGVKNAVGRMISEFASIRILQGSGLAGLFGLSTSASASTGGGFDVTSLLSSGFGITNAIGGGISALGGATGIGSLTAFGQAFGGDAIAAFAGGAGSLGATLGSFAGPAAIAGVADIALRQLFGNKKLGGTAGDVLSYIPVVGTLINGLFGRGPEKLRRQAIEGTATGQGFEGSFDTIFKAKGGLFRSDKIRRESFDPFGQFQGLLDESIQGFSGSIRGIADNLGLATSPLDNFNQQISILSEKGKELTKEQISQGIADIGEVMAREVLPNFREFAGFGESAGQVLSRINAEFGSLSFTLQVLGQTAEQSKTVLQALTIEERTNLVNRAGGVDALNAKMTEFFNNLDDSDKLDRLSERLLTALRTVDVGFIPTMEQFNDAMLSGKLSTDQFIAGLNLQGLIREFNSLKDSVDSVTPAVANLSGLNDAFQALDKSVQAERNRLTEEYNLALQKNNSEIQSITESLSQLNSLSAALQQTIESINPVGLNAARSNISSAIASARSGNIIDLQSVRGSLNALTSTDTSGFGSRVDFLRSQAQNAGLVSEFSSVVDRQISSADRSVSELQQANDLLKDGFDNEQDRLDSILDNARLQLDALNGIDSSILSLAEALKNFNNASGALGGASNIGNPDLLPFSNKDGSIRTNLPQVQNRVSAQDIRNFFSTDPTPEQIAAAARANNLGSGQIASALGLGRKQIDDFFLNNPDIPRFATGTSFVPRTGPAIVHKGERIINTEQNKDLVDTLKELLTEMRQMKEHSRKTAQILDDVSAGGGAFLTEAA